jgi:hypothetical protein
VSTSPTNPGNCCLRRSLRLVRCCHCRFRLVGNELAFGSNLDDRIAQSMAEVDGSYMYAPPLARWNIGSIDGMWLHVLLLARWNVGSMVRHPAFLQHAINCFNDTLLLRSQSLNLATSSSFGSGLRAILLMAAVSYYGAFCDFSCSYCRAVVATAWSRGIAGNMDEGLERSESAVFTVVLLCNHWTVTTCLLCLLSVREHCLLCGSEHSNL